MERNQGPSPAEAAALLASVPPRPVRRLGPRDHLYTAVTILGALASGVLALSGSPWWALVPGVLALMTSHHWIEGRQKSANEPRLKRAGTITLMFTLWLVLPIWRGIRHGDTAPFPELLILAGLAPMAWLIYYIILLVKR